MSRRFGMTLVEVLAALAILVLLAGGVLGFFGGMVERRDQMVSLSGRQRDVAMLVDRLEAALFTSLSIGPDGEAGILGEADSVIVVQRASCPAAPGVAALADAQTSSFRFSEAEGIVRFAVTPAGGAALEEPALAGVQRLRLRYHDGTAWRSSFDSLGSGSLPVAIEVAIWLRPRGAATPAPETSEEPPHPDEESLEAAIDDFAGADILAAETPFSRERSPDVLRVIAIPDASSAGWREGSP